MKYKIKIKNPIYGVPITVLNSFSPKQFEIIGLNRYAKQNTEYGSRFKIDKKEKYARILIRQNRG